MSKADKRPPKVLEPLALPAPSGADARSIRLRRSSFEAVQAGHIGQRLLTPNEAARFLGVSRRKLYSLMADGSLSFIYVGSRRRLDRKELEAFIESNRTRLGRLER